MAGIGFRLQALITRGSYLEAATAYLSSAVITSGPWLAGVAALTAINTTTFTYLSASDHALLSATMVFLFASSLLIAGGPQLAITRYLADLIYVKKYDMIAPTCTGMIFLLLPLAVISLPFVFFAPFDLRYCLIVYTLFVTLTMIWLIMMFLSAAREHLRILAIFVLSYAISVGASLIIVMSVLLTSACSSQAKSTTKSITKSITKPIGISMQEQPNAPATPPAVSKVKNTSIAASRRSWSQIHNWAYWLDNPDLKTLDASNFEMLVIDYSADGSAQKAFTAQQITTLRKSACQRRVVAYLSIGEAESYRGYWQQNWKAGNPSWLGEVDPDWEQNYWVRYWEPDWQQIIYRYIDAIIAAGFDGIYLDRIDAYQEDYAVGHEDDMVNFVLNIAQYARAHSPLKNDFGIFVQNAEELAVDHVNYMNAITGIGREEVYVYATNKPTSLAERYGAEQNLDRLQQKGKLVLTVDYADQGDLIKQTYERARTKNYVPYVTDVDLDRLQNNKGYEPTCQPF